MMKEWLAILLLLTVSCSLHHSYLPSSPENKINLPTPAANADNTIVFLTFKITQTDSLTDKYNITLINSTLASGKLKNKSFKEAAVIEKGYLYYELSADEKGLQHYEKVDDPLQKIYEFPGEEQQDLSKKIIVKKTGEFIIRFQYHPSLKYLNIYKPIQDSHLKPVYSAKILP